MFIWCYNRSHCKQTSSGSQHFKHSARKSKRFNDRTFATETIAHCYRAGLTENRKRSHGKTVKYRSSEDKKAVKDNEGSIWMVAMTLEFASEINASLLT